MSKKIPPLKLSRLPGNKPKKAMLQLGEISCNIADGVFYTKILDKNGNEIIVSFGGKQYEKLKEFDPDSFSPEIEIDIVSSLEIGGISRGHTFTKGTTINSFIQALLDKTFYPALTDPEASMSINAPSNVEAGHSQSITLSMDFSKGSILGSYKNDVWDETEKQNDRAGPVTHFVFSDVNTGKDNFLDIGSFVIGDETLEFNASVFFEAGPQPLDSKNNPFDSALPAGALHKSVSITGRRRLFYGHSSSADSSLAIRTLQSSLLGPSIGTEFIINAPEGATNIVIAYPASLSDLSSVIHTQGAMAQIVSQFEQSTVNVNGLNGFAPISYKVFKLNPAAPLFAPATFICKI